MGYKDIKKTKKPKNPTSIKNSLAPSHPWETQVLLEPTNRTRANCRYPKFWVYVPLKRPIYSFLVGILLNAHKEQDKCNQTHKFKILKTINHRNFSLITENFK